MLELYSRRVRRNGSGIGNAKKRQSDMVMEQSWGRDIESRDCFLYDYWHDPDIFPHLQLQPHNGRTPVEAKMLRIGSNSTSKDQCDFLIQFRPSFVCPFDLENDYSKKTYLYPQTFPIGLYIDIPNNRGVYEKWLIVGDNRDVQFPTYIVLPCNYKFTWVNGNKKYRMWGCDRSRNSYNSGLNVAPSYRKLYDCDPLNCWKIFRVL